MKQMLKNKKGNSPAILLLVVLVGIIVFVAIGAFDSKLSKLTSDFHGNSFVESVYSRADIDVFYISTAAENAATKSQDSGTFKSNFISEISKFSSYSPELKSVAESAKEDSHYSVSGKEVVLEFPIMIASESGGVSVSYSFSGQVSVVLAG